MQGAWNAPSNSLVALRFIVIVVTVFVIMISPSAVAMLMRVRVLMAGAAFHMPIFSMFRVIAVTLVEHFGVLKGVAFAGDTCKQGRSGKKVKRLHRVSF